MNRYIPDIVLHKDQCTLHDCIRLINIVLKIFAMSSDIVLSEYIYIWSDRYRVDSLLHMDYCALQHCIRLFNSVLKMSFIVH